MWGKVLNLMIALGIAIFVHASQVSAVAQIEQRAIERSEGSLRNAMRIRGGYVLTHEHPAVGMAFGGNYAFAGSSGNYINGVMEKGYDGECSGCGLGNNCDHGEFKGSLFEGEAGKDMGAHQGFEGPHHKSFSHIRYATDWVKEAFRPTQRGLRDARMKIMVAFALENEALCEQLYYVNHGNGGAGGNGYACSSGDSLASMERQLNAIKAWVARNSDWMEIAYSASDARRIVNADKLAIVLGIEAEYAFGAENSNVDPVNRLMRYYNQGVRTFYLAHKINSRLAGSDIYYPDFTTTGKIMRATQAISGCLYYDDHVGDFPLVRNGHNFCDNDERCGPNNLRGKTLAQCNSKISDISETKMLDYVFSGHNTFNGFKIYPSTPGFTDSGGSRKIRPSYTRSEDPNYRIEVNRLGLSRDGKRVVRRAMNLGMIVNLDHVSRVARQQIYEISQGYEGYPLNALHNNPNEMVELKSGLLASQNPHEYDFDLNEREMIKETDGIFGVRLGPLDARDYDQSGVRTECPGTSTETAKILASLIDEGLNIGYSLDLATVTKGVTARSVKGCNTAHFSSKDPLNIYGDGQGGVYRDVGGLTHIGMMKKWHKELEHIGLRDRYLNQLKNDGAEAFVRMWEISEAKGRKGDRAIEAVEGSISTARPTGTVTATQSGALQRVCRTGSDCSVMQYCPPKGVGRRVCKAKKANNRICTHNYECSSNQCTNSRCEAVTLNPRSMN